MDIDQYLNDLEFRTFSTAQSFRDVLSFWDKIEDLSSDNFGDLKESLIETWNVETEEDNQILGSVLNGLDNEHDRIMIKSQRYSGIIYGYSVFERELLRLAQNVSNNDNYRNEIKSYRGSVVEKISKFLKNKHSLDLSSTKNYPKIKEYQMIRDCLAHCNGELFLSRDRYTIENKLSNSYSIETVSHEIEIKGDFLEKMIVDFWDFYVEVFDRLNWKINNRKITSHLEQRRERRTPV